MNKIIFLILLVLAKISYASDKTSSTPIAIPSLDEIRSAAVVFAPSNWVFSIRLDEETFRAAGCTYTSSDSERILELLQILINGNIRTEENFDASPKPEPREGVFFYLENGQEIKLLFGQRFNNRSTVQGIFHEKPIVADPSLPQNLMSWASRFGRLVTEEPSRRQACEIFNRDFKKN